MGQARNAASPASRPALRQRLSVRRHLPGARGRRGAGAALRRHRHDAAPPRRNLAHTSPRAPTPCCCSTAPDGTPPASSTMPDNITPIFLPSRAPELNPVENVWQYLAQNWLSNPSSKTTTRSSTPPATLGATSSPTQKESRQSACESGRTSVTAHDSWYYGESKQEFFPRPYPRCGGPEGRGSIRRMGNTA